MRPPLPKAIGRIVASIRKDMGYSQESFADHLQYHRTYMGDLERGEKDMRLSTLERLAKALKLTSSQLLQKAEKLQK